jgi:hypothetical protein
MKIEQFLKKIGHRGQIKEKVYQVIREAGSGYRGIRRTGCIACIG